MLVVPLAVVISAAAFPFNVFASLKRREPPPWRLFPLPHTLDSTKLSRRKANRARDMSIWEALSRLGRVYYSYTDDPTSEPPVLLLAIQQLLSDTLHMSQTERHVIAQFAFTPHDLWEGEALYQFLQGLVITSRDRTHRTMEVALTACLDELYTSYATRHTAAA
ncbi:hypothetical protein DYB28_003816 [Aphanomyces astaci]|uniref:Uncharacterized protein n=1 Tax=Aphanomyces astaci TaxID=112090 RepID=A0A397CP03_APHAT|nr:hypothetical protein AaE_007587 [Aphanomyces astaci]RHY03076.1 hypothetical protein DYB36_011389 [Aphanomyces astaci]RHY18953.1 hypothetical protein DYB25_008013 [Aphanomyces astaci]RHY46770.1 hypothetical protein DYB38_010676 [Aphanomyces astaci]RHY48889.1 hypothetical protein DYB30_010940 [Aphanomyces astaci]